MFGFRSEKKRRQMEEKIDELNSKSETKVLTSSLEKNITLIQQLFEGDDTLVTRRVKNSQNGSLHFCLFYCDGLVNSVIINENIVKPLMLSQAASKGGDLLKTLLDQVIQINEVKKSKSVSEIIKSVTYGDTILLVDGEEEVLILNSRFFLTRSITEPNTEKVISGPREGFCEALLMNLSMVRRRLRTNELKMKFQNFGERTKTQICVCYIDGIVNKKVLDELYRRLEKIHIDGVLDSNYLSEFVRDSRFSPFRTTGYTERPDVVVAKLLEGRVAVFVDGSPVVMTVPYLFIENFQSNEDYYLSFYYSSFSRILRILAFAFTIVIPAFYIAVATFHHEMLPTTLLISIAKQRSNVPLPDSLEIILMLLAFDILRETGIRMPSNSSQALSIVGALVIGQAAVDAKLVAAPIIIIVAFTAITSLLVPKLNASITFIRFGLLLLSSSLGFFGLILGLSAIFVHLYSMRSFGVPHLADFAYPSFQNLKDIFIRAPWWKMRERPADIAEDKVRINNDEIKNQENYD